MNACSASKVVGREERRLVVAKKRRLWRRLAKPRVLSSARHPGTTRRRTAPRPAARLRAWRARADRAGSGPWGKLSYIQFGVRRSAFPSPASPDRRYARASSDTGCTTRTGAPASFNPRAICRWQPGLAVATISRAGGGDVVHLAPEQRVGLFRLRHRIDSRASATPRRFGQLRQRHDPAAVATARAAGGEIFWPCTRWQDSW